MSYFKHQLLKNEEIVASAQIHLICLVRALLAFLALVVLYKVSVFMLLLLGYFFLKIVIEDLVHYFGTEYLVTDRRFLIKRGIFSLNTQEIFLGRLETSLVEQNWLGRWLDFGSITLVGIGGTVQKIFTIKNPQGFRNQLQKQIAARQDHA